MSDLPPIFTPIPEMPRVPSVDEKIQQAVQQILKLSDERIAHFDTDIVLILGIIVDALCLSGQLQREQMIQTLENLHRDRKPVWGGEYSPLTTLAMLLSELEKYRDSGDSSTSSSWLKEVIEGGLSKKPATEPAD